LRHVRRVERERAALEYDVMHRPVAGRILHLAADTVPTLRKLRRIRKDRCPGFCITATQSPSMTGVAAIGGSPSTRVVARNMK
jgi:hypothetical protein